MYIVETTISVSDADVMKLNKINFGNNHVPVRFEPLLC